MADALILTRGNQRLAAEALRCARRTVQYYLERHPELRDLVRELHLVVGDVAKHNVYEAVMQGDLPTSRWLLGRDYEFRSLTEVRVQGGEAPLRHEHTHRHEVRFVEYSDPGEVRAIAAALLEAGAIEQPQQGADPQGAA